jgi:hypothetical protein
MKIKDNNFFYINIIVVVFFVFAMDLPRNLYNLLLHKYANRIYSIYGVCEKESYGYLEKIVNQYGTKTNINSYNFEDYPKSSTVFFYKKNYKFDNNKLIILNYDSENINHKKIFLENFSNYKILDNYKNKCFLIEKL